MTKAYFALLPIALGLLLSGPSRGEKPAPAPAPADLPPCPSSEDKPDVHALVKRTETQLKGRSSIATMTMTIKTRAWSRTLKMKVASRGQDYALVHILEGGPREVGMMTLKREKQLWNYLPQAGRVMKLPSGMTGDWWMGSDLTNDDLVNGSSMSEDFTHALAGLATQDGREAWKVVLTPKPSATVVWGRIEMLVDRKTCLPLDERFFDEDGKPARHMAFSELKQVGSRLFPAKTTVFPSEEGRETSIHYDEIEFDVDIPDDTFGLERLRAGR
jgi:outer membrane lipoprotein-sorting protein